LSTPATREGDAEAPGALSAIRDVFGSRYQVPAALVLLLAIVPVYILIPEFLDGRTLHRPALAIDRILPVQPAWALVYGSLYLFLILLPVLLVRDVGELRAAAHAYLAVWLTSYVAFMAYPTVAMRPATVVGSGFLAASLRLLYSADTRFNCFPSLHVAHSFVSAFVCRRVHRGVGDLALGAATLVALSTLFTKQHYALDVIAGVLLAAIAARLFLPRSTVTATQRLERPVAPLLAGLLVSAMALLVVVTWIAYALVVRR
jgi:membrane-associated phospholipid phosphatase